MGADQQLSVERLWRDGAAVAGATRPCAGFGAGGLYLEMVAGLDAEFPGGPYGHLAGSLRGGVRCRSQRSEGLFLNHPSRDAQVNCDLYASLYPMYPGAPQ